MTRRLIVAFTTTFLLAVGTVFGQGSLPPDQEAEGGIRSYEQFLSAARQVFPSGLGVFREQAVAAQSPGLVDRRNQQIVGKTHLDRSRSQEQGSLVLGVDPAPWAYAHGYRDKRLSAATWTRLGNPTRLALRERRVESEVGILMPRMTSADEDLLKSIYGLGRPFGSVMLAAEASAWPVFIGAVPIVWVIAAVNKDRRDVRAALSIAMSEGVAAAASMGFKRLVGRARPYTVMPSIVARSKPHRDGRARDPYSFPSGHAALSFSLATAVALESERWYVTIPVFVWASAVSVSRVWLGVHYPTDVLAGAILGSGAGFGMYALARAFIGDEDANGVGNIQMTIMRVGF